MLIGEVAKEAGVGVETVRFYEQRGLIPQPPRPSDGGYRQYSIGEIRRIKFIRRAQDLGFSLGEIGDLLKLEAGESGRCVDVRRRAEHKRDDVQGKLDNLARIKTALDTLIEACPGKGPARKCSILGAIKSGELHLSRMTKEENHGEQNSKN